MIFITEKDQGNIHNPLRFKVVRFLQTIKLSPISSSQTFHQIEQNNFRHLWFFTTVMHWMAEILHYSSGIHFIKEKQIYPLWHLSCFSAWSNSCRFSFKGKHFGTLEHVKRSISIKPITLLWVWSLTKSHMHKASYICPIHNNKVDIDWKMW